MDYSRRSFIQKLGYSLPIVSLPLTSWGGSMKLLSPMGVQKRKGFHRNFKSIGDRTWIGADFWSVPMEDWEIKKGRLEFSGNKKSARLHFLTEVVQPTDGSLTMEAKLGLLEAKGDKGAVGFNIGIQDQTDPASIKAACYYGQGIAAGVSLEGKIFLGEKSSSLPVGFDFKDFSLKFVGDTSAGKSTGTLLAIDSQKRKAELTNSLEGTLEGLVALENNILQKDASTFWWSEVSLSGNKVVSVPDNSFGPILWSMYTLSDGQLKLSAQMAPLGKADTKVVSLELLKAGKWVEVAKQNFDPLSYVATFSLPYTQAQQDQPFRVSYRLGEVTHTYKGCIRKEPTRQKLLFGGLTCQNWLGYPYRPLVENLEKSNPDLLYFSGDQIYEENGGYPIKREPEDKAILSYLGKWFMFGWSFGNIMRDRPTICTPDDHDVFQGNLWGDGGVHISLEEWAKKRDAHGGFVQTTAMVNVVNQTQCAHLPDPIQAEPLPSGISTWFTALTYGRVSFAIVSDRYFKSGPEKIRPGEGRIDHIREPLPIGTLESDELSYLGKQQVAFLENWVTDWHQADMKVLLSQTLFSSVGTHHGPKKEYLTGDLDSGGWPKKQKDDVLRIMRKACVFHINGDQHVPFLLKYSIDEPKDGSWTYCTPAISTGYPRWGQPDLVNMPFTDRPAHNLPHTGCYRDVFGNDNYVYAVGNPDDDFREEKNRYVASQKKASGFGLITFDTQARTIKMEAYRFLADLASNDNANTYPGWPLTISQFDNDGRRALGFLPQLSLSEANQLVQVIDEESGEVVSALRTLGKMYRPKVYAYGKYSVVVGEGASQKTIAGLQLTTDPNALQNV
ncbi:PhoD-like phosphatase [Dyadobacter jejuensis]|uniref:PhoD-like phosphatase n=1 Tax=Dyadobacter jejuensis TaxID=1082580 RepID=A0A316AHW7_9BACT|nr:alkaline phosphatase D family protein [Dyadobacter jejuensis]PWJ56849.1 PhoD-like phosphatase [Dyadobacter jejuensis]